MNQLDQIEYRIKEIIERSSDLLPWTDHTAILIRHFCESLRQFLIEDPDCLIHSPSKIRVYCSPDEFKRWLRLPGWQKIMLDAFNETVTELNCKPNRMPEIILFARNSLQNDLLVFNIEENQAENGKTGAVNLSKPIPPPVVKNESDSGRILINQDKVIPVDKVVLNLGRKSTNDVVINDLRVSRFHAQIRKTADGYMVFDVGSTGGTFVNGKRISSYLLNSGDVISLAGYPLIFSYDKDHNPIPEREITSDLTHLGGEKS